MVKEGWAGDERRGTKVPILCVHGDIRNYPTGDIEMEVRGVCVKRRFNVGITKGLPYDIILGKDWPEFKELVRKHGEVVNCLGREDKETEK